MRNAIFLAILALIACVATLPAQVPVTPVPPVVVTPSVCSAPNCRSSAVARRFGLLTHFAPTSGWIKDHMVPLECGGRDEPENMMWMTVAEAAYKDRIENQCWRWTPRVRSDTLPNGTHVPPPNPTPPVVP